MRPIKQWSLNDDSEAARDAHRYEVPIPSREFLLEAFEAAARPLAFEEVFEGLGLTDDRQKDGIGRRLRAMERDGQLICNRAGHYGLVDKMDLVRGRVQSHRDGYGFLTPETGGEDLFLSPRTMRSLMHGDKIIARLSRSADAGRREAKLVELIERSTTHVVGRYFRERTIGFVYPERRVLSQDLMIPPEYENGAEEGQMVVARLIPQSSPRARPVGEIVEVLGQHMAPGLEIDVAIRAHGIPSQWPEAVTDACEGLGAEVEEVAKEGRQDLRQMPLVTIDGADAKDFDDAVFCKKTPKGWRLVVAIADVSAYVEAGSALDAQAIVRGNSTYFPGHVVPMLPEVLSNGLCSINPHRDRLCMVCDMTINAQGEVTRSRFYEAVMHSQARLTYDEVAEAVVERTPAVREELGELCVHLDELYALYGALAGARNRRGCLDFDTRETQIVFGPDRKIDRIVPVSRNDAHRIIEECMISANVCAARFLERHKAGGLFRVHAQPNNEKVADLRTFLAPLGIKLGGGKEPKTADFARAGEMIAGRPEARMVNTALLRTLPQARYATNCDGHFGLALEHYAHFTSPIRRYPDLVVHRAIKKVLGAPGASRANSEAELTSIAEQCSTTERRSDDAGRDVLAWLKCEYMLEKVGEEFAGTVSGVAPFGVFVELDGVFVEGLVHVSGLGREYFHYDAVHHALRAEGGGTVFKVGTRVQVRVVRVDLDDRKIDFELMGGDRGDPGAKGSRKRKPSSGKKRSRRR
jgi:ribonuclease R